MISHRIQITGFEIQIMVFPRLFPYISPVAFIFKLYSESFFGLSAGLRREERDRRHPTEDAEAQAQPSPTELTTFSALTPSKLSLL
jgi:hypothetical protein